MPYIKSSIGYIMRAGILIFLLFIFLHPRSIAQSCCSGGVPLSSNLGLPASQAGILQINLSYDLNVLNTLKVERERLEDDSRNRKTHSSLFQLSYSLTDRFALEGFFSYIRQERRITQDVGTSLEVAQGLGDAVFLFKYKLFATAQDATVWQAALGAKAPIGPYNRRGSNGLVLNAELQPGGGAWDAIVWTQLAHSMNWRPSMSFSTTATYSRKGENKDYLDGSQIYKFGNEWQLIVGLSDRLIMGKQLFDPSLSLRYRDASADRVDGFDLPSTGGKWIFLNPAFSYWWTSDLASNMSVEVPLYAEVIGTQFSPTYRINIGFFYRIATRKTKPLNN